MSPTQEDQRGRGVMTNGENQPCTNHLNLTVTLEDWMSRELAAIRKASPQYYEQRLARSAK